MSATDEAGSVLKLSDITVSGTVDPTKAGRYEVTYSYTDAAGNDSYQDSYHHSSGVSSKY
ncbi:bacterial Ig-like domain-containing protein [Lactiplantibacillus plantarum]|uniref:bacterial Ig-like domain-containing protein n=1 Tax=Lactiplantibacillus plantarum TaxID=1590 RepID=UPI0022E81BCF|nr:bacterial Ig-like domain-containing protein [Lactiplantibacillus plantarum]